MVHQTLLFAVSVGNPSSLNGINANGGVKGNTAGQGGSWTTGGVGGSVPIQYGGTGGSGGAGAGYNFHGVGGSGAQGVVVVKYLTSAVQ